MNLFYEEYPKALEVHGEFYPIITDFREYIRLLDMLKCKELNEIQRIMILGEYFLTDISIDQEAIHALTGFVTMDLKEKENNSDSEEEWEGQEETEKKNLFSYEIDYPYILSGFLRDYGIDLETVEYLHWWKFRMLFDGLSDDTEVKQRIMYRGINLSDIKDRDERKRILKIQRSIQLPAEELTDYEIGHAFA